MFLLGIVMKYRKTIVFALLLATACGVAYCSTQSVNSAESGVKLTGVKVDNTDKIDFSQFKWLKQYPQLANIESNNQTAVIDKLRTSESISQLIGPINNPYGVRDDILYGIISVVPESQPQLLKIAIKEAYYRNLGYYSLKSEDKLKYIRLSNLSFHCSYMLGDLDMADKLLDNLRDKYRNTDARLNYISNVEQTTFAWQTLGYGEGEDQRCKRGDY
jgi:hypothetical protein